MIGFSLDIRQLAWPQHGQWGHAAATQVPRLAAKLASAVDTDWLHATQKPTQLGIYGIRI
jgi:hypothetical protein